VVVVVVDAQRAKRKAKSSRVVSLDSRLSCLSVIFVARSYGLPVRRGVTLPRAARWRAVAHHADWLPRRNNSGQFAISSG